MCWKTTICAVHVWIRRSQFHFFLLRQFAGQIYLYYLLWRVYFKYAKMKILTIWCNIERKVCLLYFHFSLCKLPKGWNQSLWAYILSWDFSSQYWVVLKLITKKKVNGNDKAIPVVLVTTGCNTFHNVNYITRHLYG